MAEVTTGETPTIAGQVLAEWLGRMAICRSPSNGGMGLRFLLDDVTNRMRGRTMAREGVSR